MGGLLLAAGMSQETKGHWIQRDQTEGGSVMVVALYPMDILPTPAAC